MIQGCHCSGASSCPSVVSCLVDYRSVSWTSVKRECTGYLLMGPIQTGPPCRLVHRWCHHLSCAQFDPNWMKRTLKPECSPLIFTRSLMLELHWILDLLSERPQAVGAGTNPSHIITLSMGAPPGWLYCQIQHKPDHQICRWDYSCETHQ